jgi:hypothetical protein
VSLNNPQTISYYYSVVSPAVKEVYFGRAKTEVASYINFLMEDLEVKHRAFQTSALDMECVQVQSPAVLLAGKISRVPVLMRGWVDPRSGLDTPEVER